MSKKARYQPVHPIMYGKHALDQNGCVSIRDPDPTLKPKHRDGNMTRRRYYRIEPDSWSVISSNFPEMSSGVLMYRILFEGRGRWLAVQNVPFSSGPGTMGNINEPHFNVIDQDEIERHNKALGGWVP